jgi:hypothetical protein
LPRLLALEVGLAWRRFGVARRRKGRRRFIVVSG